MSFDDDIGGGGNEEEEKDKPCAGNAVRIAQEVLKNHGHNLTVDGGMGPNTLNAINSANQMDLYNNLKQTRIDFYNGIVQRDPIQSKFLNGWLNRINKFKDKKEEDNQHVNCPE